MQVTSSSVSRAVLRIPKDASQIHVQCRSPHLHLLSKGRGFKTSASLKGVMGTVQLPKHASKTLPKQQGTNSRMKAMGREEFPNDFGLMPLTFIRPPSDELPSIFSSPKERLSIEWTWTKTRFQNFLMLYYLLRWGGKTDPITKKTITEPLQMRERTSMARHLHKLYYTALAAGDMNTIKDIACNGLVKTSRIIIDRRPADLGPMKFDIVNYIGFTYPRWMRWLPLTFLPFHSTKIMSDRINQIPLGKDAWLRQMVVRIKSKQRLYKGKAKGHVEAMQTEYVVLQKLKVKGTEQPWMLWGTVQPSLKQTLQTIEGLQQATGRSSITETVKNKVAGMGLNF